MGLFSFLKKAGENVISKPAPAKAAPAAKTVLDEAAERAAKINSLRDMILSLNLEVTDLDPIEGLPLTGFDKFVFDDGTGVTVHHDL